MPEENKYVLKTDHIADIGKLTGRIKDIDNKHMQLHNDLKLTITSLSLSTQALTETSKKTNNILESIDEKMDGYNDRIKDVEYNVETTTKRVDNIEHSVSERKKGNVQLWVAIIGALGTVIVGALGFAQLFF
ncbi:hypothetical protein [Mammaliicoccus sciuri]|uniref:hypothetical protein n=1 Tax=Mammaliicoccus sciuri TaxID=1296 RepID=UPI001951DBB7|nr:hypothetical protein [Mammaliicoccus sciuri]